ncbi:unnamed protein product [Absidia cylindrospora]
MAEHPNKLAFHEGVTYIFKTWTALKLAVEQDWGGVELAEKRDWMIELITDYFGKNILNQIMSDEFHTLLEDDSAYLVAKHLVELFNQCINGNFSEVERLRQKNQTQAATSSSCVQQGGEDDGDSDLEGDDINSNDMDDDDMDMDDSNSKQLDESPSGPDEDGWETVRSKK